MTKDLKKSLKTAGKTGIAYSLADRTLPEVRRQVAKLRNEGHKITEKLESGSKMSAFGRRIRFVWEEAA